ncbi:hypothetical protein LZ578_01640 [Jeotgalibaca sp. MA1X17-3]|nr:hypothetical protein [Jeotgalibaca sp. MA1X17-3]UJF15875.1 hypothetical protein LZ578_01640 [Jeotgalibaca sp. MA1X17-3]
MDDQDAPPFGGYDLEIEPDPLDQEEQKEQEVVDQAISLFGQENVTVMND